MTAPLACRISYDAQGTPAVWAESPTAAYLGIGYLHGRLRPLQTALLATAAQGRVAEHVLGRADLVGMDALVHRLDLPGRAAAEVSRLSPRAALWLDAYVDGCRRGLAAAGRPLELRLLLARLAAPSRVSVLAGTMLAAYLGLAEGQERMERALVDAVGAGVDTTLLSRMLAPHLDGFDAEVVRGLPRRAPLGFASHARVATSGGSNAWAVTPERSQSGHALLCGDPHLQVNQLPSLFLELRARVGDEVWLGATIPGLPGVAVGRNRSLAWSGTFACADNVDFAVEECDGRSARRADGAGAVVEREVVLRRRLGAPLRLRFFASNRGVLESEDQPRGRVLATAWAGGEKVAEALEAYMALPLATSVAEAELVLRAAHTFSLHFVLADRAGDVAYCQAGRVPRRSDGWSGLYPVDGAAKARWTGFYEGSALPREGAVRGVVASANEARPAADGAALATLAQPGYRRDRIIEVLEGSRACDVAGMQALQLDVRSLQAERLLPRLLSQLPNGPLRTALLAWDRGYDVDSVGAHAFELAYGAARLALSEVLGGGGWLAEMVAHSELSVWWCAAIDRALADSSLWHGERASTLARRLTEVGGVAPTRWGDVHRFCMPNMVLGGLPLLGLDRGPFALPGCIATVRQGTISEQNGQTVVTAPAYRFVTDLGDDGAWSCVAGSIDGAPRGQGYDRWLPDWLEGRYHALLPPSEDEPREAIA